MSIILEEIYIYNLVIADSNRPKFIYTERNNSLGLYVIHNILIYIFLDNAFASPYIKYPRDV